MSLTLYPPSITTWVSLTGKPVYDIRDYGAVCDGTTNDAAAFHAAIAAVIATGLGGTVFIPPGTTRIATTSPAFSLDANDQGHIIFEGSGSDSRLLVDTSIGQLLNIGNATMITLRDFAVIGKSAAGVSAAGYEFTGAGIQFSSTIKVRIERMIFAGLATSGAGQYDGIVLGYTSNLSISDSLFGGCTAPSTANVTANASAGLTVERTQFYDYVQLDGVYYSKSAVTATNRDWIRILAPTAITTANQLIGSVVRDCGFDEHNTGYCIRALGTAKHNLTLDNLGLNSGIGGTGNALLADTFRKVTVRDCWVGYNAGTWTGMTFDDVTAVDIDNLEFDNGATDIILLGTTSRAKIRNCTDVAITNTAGAFIDADQAMPATASAAALAPKGKLTHVTGAVTITSIVTTNLKPGDKITFIFDSTPTVTHGNNIILAGAANFVATANDSLTLDFDGTNLIQSGSSVN